MILNRAPVGKGACLQSLLKFPVDEPPAKFPSRAPMESDFCPLSLLLISSWIPRKGPPPVPLTEPPQREMLPLQGPATIS